MAYSEKTLGLLPSQRARLPRRQGLLKQERIIHAPQAAEIDVEFPPGSAPRRVINLCSNNYLGLSSHPEVIAAAHAGLDIRGYGMSSVRFICGTQDIHRQLEQRLTDFLGTEDTLLFPSCMDANAGVFEALLLTKDDVMIADRLVHASHHRRHAPLRGRRTTRTSTRTWSTSRRSCSCTRTSASGW